MFRRFRCGFQDGSGWFQEGFLRNSFLVGSGMVPEVILWWPGGLDALLLVWMWVLGLVPDGSGNLGACFQG